MENDSLKKRLITITENANIAEMSAYFQTFPQDRLSREYDPCDWAIGPFERIDDLTFEKKSQWNDPWNIGWQGRAIHNGSLIEHNGKLHMLYRCNPSMESLSARIGLAIYESGKGWIDYEKNVAL